MKHNLFILGASLGLVCSPGAWGAINEAVAERTGMGAAARIPQPAIESQPLATSLPMLVLTAGSGNDYLMSLVERSTPDADGGTRWQAGDFSPHAPSPPPPPHSRTRRVAGGQGRQPGSGGACGGQ